MLSTLLGLLITFMIPVVISFFLQAPNFKYYRSTYLALKSGKYFPIYFPNKEQPNMVVYVDEENPDRLKALDENDITFFVSDGSIKLLSKDPKYIHNDLLINFNPYTLYWRWKLNR